MSLHALRTGHHVKIGATVFLIVQRLPEGALQLQNTVTDTDRRTFQTRFKTASTAFNS